MSSKKTVLVVAPYFPPHSGGLERYAYETARRLAGSFRVVVLTTSDSKQPGVERMGELEVHRLGYRHKLSNSPVSFSWFGAVRRVLSDVRPDLVHIHTPVPGLGDLVARALPKKTPLLVTYHAGSMKKGVWYLDWIIALYEHVCLPRLLKRAHHIACSSDFVRKEFLASYMHRSSTITPAVDSSLFVPEHHERREAPVLIAVGGMGKGEKHKGLGRLIDLLPRLREHAPGTRLIVAGDGDQRASFQEQAILCGVQDAVEFLGRLDSPAMAAAYQRADVFVHPTHNDSFPTVVLEAMATGLPVVSTTVGSIDAMVDDNGTGYLVDPGDDTALRDRLERLLSNRALAMKLGASARDKVTKRFSWERTSGAYRNLYDTLLAQAHPIAHVVAYYPPHTGGMEYVAERLARGSAERGHPVEVLTSREGAAGAPRIELDTNLRVRRLASFEFAHTPFMWTLGWHLLRLPKETLVHIHVAQAYVPELALLCARLRGLRTVAHFHLDVERSGPLGFLFDIYKKTILPFVLRHVDAVLVASDGQAQFLVKHHGVSARAVKQIVNAVDDMFFQTRQDHTPHTPFRILTLSRLTVQKRVDRLVGAMQHVSFPAELTVVGDGEDREKLEAQAQRIGAAHIQFVGQKTHKDIPTYHAWADVFVIPSDREGGMPLNVLEAMAAGLPVVGSDAPGVRDLVEGVGVVVADPSPETFAAALARLHDAPDTLRTLSLESSARAAGCTWPAAVARVEEIYHEVQQ